jgi:hypothetical protein
LLVDLTKPRNPRYVAALALVACLILIGGWLARPRDIPESPAPPPSETELEQLARRAERRSLDEHDEVLRGSRPRRGVFARVHTRCRGQWNRSISPPSVNSRYPQFAPVVSTVVLASVAVFEMVGPASTRFALVHAGEAGLAVKSGPETLPVEL